MPHMRNLETGEIKALADGSPELLNLKSEKTRDGRFPLWEQTSPADADPEQFASSYEVENRAVHGVPLHDVKSDGTTISEAHAPAPD